MHRFGRRLFTAPLYVQFLFAAAVFGLGTYAFDAADSTHGEPLVVHLIGGVVFGAFMTCVIAWRRRKEGGPGLQLAVITALKAGRLAEDVDPQVWRTALDRQERTMRRLRRWGPIEFGLFAALDLTLAIAGRSVWWWVSLALFVAMFVLALVTPARRLRQIETLRGELGQRIS